MIDAVIVRPARKSDIPQLVGLMNLQYNRKKDERYFHWQYFDSFYPAVLMCAISGDKVVGMFGVQKRELRNRMCVGQATDMLVAPEYRKQGIFKMLGLRAVSCFNDLDLLCVLPNLNGKDACERAFGWKTAGKIDSVFLHRNSFNTVPGRLKVDDNRSEKETMGFRYGAETRIWRFDQHPDYKYSYIRLTSGEFAVVKKFVDPVTGVRFGDIVDFECDMKNLDLLRKLFVEAVDYLDSKGVEGITSWALPGTPLRRVVASLGFVDMPQERYFCMNILRHEHEYLYDLDNWHLVQADSEIY